MKIITDDGEINVDENELTTIPYFKALRESGMVDSGMNTCTLENMDVEIFSLYLRIKANGYLIDYLSYRVICDVGVIAIRFGDKELANLIEIRLKKDLCAQTFSFAIQYANQVPMFMSICFDYLEKYIHERGYRISTIIADFPPELILMMVASNKIYKAYSLMYLTQWYISHSEHKKIVEECVKHLRGLWKNYDSVLFEVIKRIIYDCKFIPDKEIATLISNKLIKSASKYHTHERIDDCKIFSLAKINSQKSPWSLRSNTGYIYSGGFRRTFIVHIPMINAPIIDNKISFSIEYDNITKIINSFIDFIG